MDVSFWETESFFSPSTPSLQGEHRQEEEMFYGEGETLFYNNHGKGENEKSGEEPISVEKSGEEPIFVERATHDIGGDEGEGI
jgi:hypothetical protein